METEKRLIKNSLVYLVPKFAGVGIQLLTLPILTRLLKPDDFGVVALAAVFPTLAVGICSWGMNIAAQRFFFEYRKDADSLGRYLFTAQVFLHLSLFASAIPIYIFRNDLSRWLIGHEGYGSTVFAYYLSTSFFTILGVYLTTLQNLENAKMHAFFTLFHIAVSGALNVGLCAIFKSYYGLMYSAVLSTFLASSICTVYFMRYFRRHFSFKMLKESLIYGIQTLPKSITSFLNRFVDKYLLNKMLAIQAVGIYNVGQSLGNSSNSFMDAIWSSFQPLCYRQAFDHGPAAAGSVGRLFSHFLFTTACPLLVLLVFSPELLAALTPPAYAGAIDIIAIVLCAVATNIFGMFVGVQFAYSKKPLYIFGSTVAGTAVNVLLNIWLIPRWGLLGAALALLGSYVTTNGLLTAIGQALYRIHYEWGFILCVYTVIVASAVASILLRALETPYGVQLMFKFGSLFLLLLAGARWKIATVDKARQIIALLRKANPPAGAFTR